MNAHDIYEWHDMGGAVMTWGAIFRHPTDVDWLAETNSLYLTT